MHLAWVPSSAGPAVPGLRPSGTQVLPPGEATPWSRGASSFLSLVSPERASWARGALTSPLIRSYSQAPSLCLSALPFGRGLKFLHSCCAFELPRALPCCVSCLAAHCWGSRDPAVGTGPCLGVPPRARGMRGPLGQCRVRLLKGAPGVPPHGARTVSLAFYCRSLPLSCVFLLRFGFPLTHQPALSCGPRFQTEPPWTHRHCPCAGGLVGCLPGGAFL